MRQPGDRLLLCSDGLSNELDDDDRWRDWRARRSSLEDVGERADRGGASRPAVATTSRPFCSSSTRWTSRRSPIKTTMSRRAPPVAPPARASATSTRVPAPLDVARGSAAAAFFLGASSRARTSCCTGTRTRPTTWATTRRRRGLPGSARRRALVQAGDGRRRPSTRRRSFVPADQISLERDDRRADAGRRAAATPHVLHSEWQADPGRPDHVDDDHGATHDDVEEGLVRVTPAERSSPRSSCCSSCWSSARRPTSSSSGRRALDASLVESRATTPSRRSTREARSCAADGTILPSRVPLATTSYPYRRVYPLGSLTVGRRWILLALLPSPGASKPSTTAT